LLSINIKNKAGLEAPNEEKGNETSSIDLAGHGKTSYLPD